jgi:benzodiazapine receptor
LRKPSWQPPDGAFGPIWTTILGLAAWAGVLGWNAADTADEQAAVLIVYVVNFVCHIAWSLLIFKLKRPDWSLAESMFLWGSVIAMINVLANLKPFAAWLLVPYILWVSIATVLNWTIVRLNGPFGRSVAA